MNKIITAGFSATLKALKTAANNAIEMAIQMEKWNSIDWNKENEMDDNTHNAKCEWKDGKFKPCEKIDGFAMWDSNEVYFKYGITKLNASFCPFCGADIRKPEPSVIIRKSGETQVVLFRGINYLLMKKNVTRIGQVWTDDGIERLIKDGDLKQISEIEITDEIAKLRPMVMIEAKTPQYRPFSSGSVPVKAKLFSAKPNFFTTNKGDVNLLLRGNIDDGIFIRLATVSDLEATS